jgi:hypothetical protein
VGRRAWTWSACAPLLSASVIASVAVASVVISTFAIMTCDAAPADHGTFADETMIRTVPRIPLPPPRPVEFGGGKSEMLTRSLPDVPTPAPTNVAAVTVPRMLPPATRDRMHACGREWQQIKWSGSAGERTWRDFAMECLPR